MWAILSIASQLETANTVPKIASVKLIMSQNSADVVVKFVSSALPGRAYCSAFSFSQSPASTSALKSSGASSSFAASNSADLTTTVTVYGLLALTTYDFYCLSEDVFGNSASLSSMLSTRVTNTTTCCRRVAFSNSPKTLYSNWSTSTAPEMYSYSYYLTAAPNKGSFLTVTPMLFSPDNREIYADIHPASTTFDALSDPASLYSSFVISRLSEGAYMLNLSLSGSASLQYMGSKRLLTVLPTPITPIPAPALSFAVFASSGRSVSIFFDSATDQASRYKLSDSWTCDLLLIFTGANVSTCTWINSTAIVAFLPYVAIGSSINLLKPGDRIATVPKKISSPCSNLTCSYTDSTYTIVQSPFDAVVPTAVLVAPSAFLPCSNLTLDAAASIGHGGRPWKEISWLVTFANNSEAPDISAYLNRLSSRGISSPLEVPASMLNSTSFIFQLRLKNFLGTSDSIAIVVSRNTMTADYTYLLSVAIAGIPFRTVKTSDPLSMQAYVLSTGCSSITSLSYSWKIYRSYELDRGLTSSSSDPRKLLLPAYALTPGETYQMVVTVASTVGPSATAMSEVYVQPSVIFAAIAGGRRREVSIFNALSLDASASADEGTPFSSSRAGLIFRWVCLLVDFAHYGDPCGLPMQSNSSILHVKAGSFAPKRIYRFIVTVYSSDKQRYSQASTDIYSVMKIIPVVLITSTFRLFNPSDKLKIDAVFSSNISVVSTWSGFFGDASSLVEFQISNGNRSLTSTSRSFTTNENTSLVSVPFPISFAHGVFSAGRTYTFRVTVTPLSSSPSVSSAYAEVQLTAHAPPSSGSIAVEPMTGYGLETQFVLSAPQWTTESDSYPLIFEFLCLLDVTDAPLSLNSPSELSYLSAQLPSGWGSNDYVVRALVRVTDLHAGLSEAYTYIRVESKTSVADVMTILRSSVPAAFALVDINVVYQLLGGVASFISASNCTLAFKCTDIGRESCKMTSHTCGSCLSGYVGVVGDSNIPCHPRAPRNITGYGNCSSCFYGNCANGVCMIPTKSCLSSRGNRNEACSGHGFCQYVSIIDRAILQQCLVTDTGCEAECVCAVGYGGKDCSKTVAEMYELRYIRERVCIYMINLTAIQDASSQLVLAESAVLRKAVDGSELDDAGAMQCASAVEQMANYAAAGYLDSADIAQQLIMDSLSSVVKMCYDFRQVSNKIASIISALIEGVQRVMTPGQVSTNIISKYVRTTVHYDTLTYLHGLTWQPPASDADIAYGVSIPTVTMPRDGLDACSLLEYYTQISLTQWVANPHGNATELKSSLLRYSSSTRNTTLLSNAFDRINRNTSFYINLEFTTAQNWTSKVPGCELFTNNQKAPCKCRAIAYGPYNVTFQCWDMNMLCPVVPKSSHYATGNPMNHAGNRRLDFDFQGSETSSSSYTDTTKSEDIGAFVAALGKEVPVTLMRSPTFEEALPAFLLVAGLVFAFLIGYCFLWRWDVLDRQLIIYTAAGSIKGQRKSRHFKRIDKKPRTGRSTLEAISCFCFGQTSSDANTSTGNRRFDVRQLLAHIRMLYRTNRNGAIESSSSNAAQRRARDKDVSPMMGQRHSSTFSVLVPNSDVARLDAFYDFDQVVTNGVEDVSKEVESDGIEHRISISKNSLKPKQDHLSRHIVSLQMDDESFSNYLPESIADRLTKKLLQTRGIVRRFLKVLLRDHDWIRIFTYKSRRITRTIRFMIVCTDLLALLFIDSLFYGVLFPSNSSTCADYSAESGGTSDQCLGQRSLWQGRDLCVWNDDEQTCDANPPPTNFEFFIIVTMLVSIFSIPFQVVMRYIFTEVVSKETDLRKVADIMNSCFGLFNYISSPNKSDGINQISDKAKLLPTKHLPNNDALVTSDKYSETVEPNVEWRDTIKMMYSFSDLLTVKEEVELVLNRVHELLTRELQVAPLPWDFDANISAGEHKARMDAIMAHLHLYADGTPMPLTWWQWLRHGSAVRHLEWKLGLIRKRERMVLDSVREATTTNDQDASLVKHFMLEQLPPLERYAVSICTA